MSNDGFAMLAEGLYPFEGKRLDFHDGLGLHYLDEGPKDARTLVMVHGNPTWSFYYRNLVLGLRDQYRCIVPDHMGCGLSDKPQKYSYTLSQHIDNLEALLEHLNIEKMTLVVHDWGGAIGMGLASRQPSWLEGLVILNTAAFFSPEIPFRISICRWPVLGSWINRGLNGFARAAVTMAVSKKSLSRELAQGYLHPYNNWANRIAIDRFVQDIPMDESHPSRKTLDDIEKALAQFENLPIEIHWGMRDFCFTPSFLNRWKQIFPQAKVFEYADSGHYILEDAGEEILTHIKTFLNSPSHV